MARRKFSRCAADFCDFWLILQFFFIARLNLPPNQALLLRRGGTCAAIKIAMHNVQLTIHVDDYGL